MAAADLDTINSTQAQGVQNLGLIYQALNNRVTFVPVPAANNSPGTPNQMAISSGFLYVCIGTNSWRRVALSTF